MSSGDTEGANQTLRKLCHLLLSSSIQAYRSAVNCELRRGHFFLPTAVHVCEKKTKQNGGAVGKKGGGGARAHCEHVNVVDRKHGHKDVMKLNLQNISVGAFTPLFQTWVTSSHASPIHKTPP